MKAVLTFKLESCKCIEVCTLHDCTWGDVGEYTSFKGMQGFELINLDTIDD